MIDFSELYPGSIVKHKYAKNGEAMSLYDIQKYKEAVENGDPSYYGTISGVPINKAWLLKFGFKELHFGIFELELNKERISTYMDKIFTVFYDIKMDKLCIELTYLRFIGKNDIENYTHDLPHIKYVHQLQSLLYLLSGVKLNMDQWQSATK
jgi:hypothetical protein